ncbi:MAG: tetratricopeptide repeat protein [Pseudomonadota bacterium]
MAALVLSGCSGSGGAGGGTGSAFTGSEEFLALMRDARDAAQDGDLDDAGRLLDEARELEPENPGLWVDIARLRFRGGEHKQALDAANYALELGPKFAPALLLKAQMVRDAYGLSDALVWFEAAAEADPNNALILSEYAATLGDAGYNAEMLGVVRALADLDPESEKVLYFQAVLSARAGKLVLAKSLLERSGEVEKGIPAALMLDAVVDLQERRFDTAAETLIRLAERQPSNMRVAELLGRALWLGGRDDELVDRFAQRARQPDASPYLIMLVGRALERQGKRAEAAPFLERGYAGRADGWVPLANNAVLAGTLPEPSARMRQMIDARQFNAARRYARSLKKRFSGSTDIAVLAGDASLAARNPSEALEFYREAALVRRPWPLTRKAAAAYRDFGDPIAADVLIARHLVGEPRNIEALLLHAEHSARAEDWLRVEVLLDNAIDLGAGNDARILKLRGIAARALGKTADAEAFERMTWDLHPAILPQG